MKKTLSLWFVVLLVSIFMTPGVSLALMSMTRDEKCDATLVKDVVKKNFSKKDHIVLSYLTTEAQFESMKKGLDTSGEFVLYGIPIKGDLSWSQFQEKRKDKLQNIKVDIDSTYSEQYYTMTLSKYGLEAYQACISKNASGLSVIEEQVFSNVAVLRVFFNVGDTSDKNKRTLKIRAKDEIVYSKTFIGNLGNGQGITVPVIRKPEQVLVVTAEVDAQDAPSTQVLVLPREPKIYQLEASKVGTMIRSVDAHMNAGVSYRSTSPLDMTPEAPGTYFDIAHMQIELVKNGITPWAKVDTKEPLHIVATAAAGVETGGRSSNITMTITVPVMQDRWIEQQ